MGGGERVRYRFSRLLSRVISGCSLASLKYVNMRSTFLSGAMQVRASPSLLTGSTRLPGFHFDRTLLGDNPTCKRCRSSRDMLRSRLPFHPGPGEDPPRDLDASHDIIGFLNKRGPKRKLPDVSDDAGELKAKGQDQVLFFFKPEELGD